MNKSIIIIVISAWFLCTLYFTLARQFHYPYQGVAMVGSWTMSILLLVCILIFIKRNKK